MLTTDEYAIRMKMRKSWNC